MRKVKEKKAKVARIQQVRAVATKRKMRTGSDPICIESARINFYVDEISSCEILEDFFSNFELLILYTFLHSHLNNFDVLTLLESANAKLGKDTSSEEDEACCVKLAC